MKTDTLYQQIKSIAQADPDRLTYFKADLTNHDRKALKNVQPGDEWIWLLRECGTNLMPCPLTCAAQLLREGVSEYDHKIRATLTTNYDWMSAVINEHMRSSRSVKAKAFHLVFSPDGEQDRHSNQRTVPLRI